MKQQQEFRYAGGEIVRLGDKVRSVAGREGVVTEILIAGTALAKQFHCANGGVLIMEDWDGVKSPRVICLPGDEDWDDVSLLGRAAS